MRHWLYVALAALLISNVILTKTPLGAQTLCPGIMPDNTMRISITDIHLGGLSEADYNAVMDKLEAYYRPIAKAKGADFTVNRLWNDDTVNSNAVERGDQWQINMFGGLARYPLMTVDALTLAACHEAGHHFGGAPKFHWASVEGEADYYGALDCMRDILGDEDNVAWEKTHLVDVVVKATCQATYPDANEAALCMRTANAGQVLANIFKALFKESATPRFDTPDTSVVATTFDDHPRSQCRLDTYFQAALCVHDIHQELSDIDYRIGTCVDYDRVGARPRCWFHPDASLQIGSLALVN